MSLFEELILASWSTGKRLDKIDEHLAEIKQQLTNIGKILATIKQTEALEMATLADIQARVAAEHDVVQSAVTLLQNLAQMLRDALASSDPAAIQAVVDQMDAETQSLADAVAANTPAAP